MNSNFLPKSLSSLIYRTLRWFSFVTYFLVFIFIVLSLVSFDILDNSFLAASSQDINNYFGEVGSYFSSFLIYCFGTFALLIPLFFLLASIHRLLNNDFVFLFLKFFIFLISIILIEQFFIYNNFIIFFFDNSLSWGILGISLSKIVTNQYLAVSSLLIGLVIIFISLDLIKFLKIKIKFSILKLNFFSTKNSYQDEKTLTKKSEPKVSRKVSPSITRAYSEQEEFTKKRIKYSGPSLEILTLKKNKSNDKISKDGFKDDAKFIEGVFVDFNINIEVVNIRVGPVITLYEVLPAPGIKINSIINLADDISRSMGATSVRIAQVYGTKFIGIEIPNKEREMVTIRELLSSDEFEDSQHKIPICIGKDITGITEVIDLSKTPHLLVAGTTGSGKSVFINSLLTSMLYKFSPDNLRFILIDPKMIELSVYNDIPHLLTPVVTEPRKAIIALKWVCKEMERRYQVMNEAGCRSIENFNFEVDEKIPFIVVVIDEMADLMMTAGKEVEHYVQRLAQKARACGIHLVMATQRPSVDIITGSIKANFPSRISFQVASKYDSRTILGEVGAEQLLGNGDMLMMKNGSGIIRYQSGFMSDKEVQKMIVEIKSNHATQYVEEIGQILDSDGDEESGAQLSDEDEILVSKSIDLIKNSGRASTSYLQRNFQIGYNKAARIMEVLEERGVVTKANHAGKREILLSD